MSESDQLWESLSKAHLREGRLDAMGTASILLSAASDLQLIARDRSMQVAHPGDIAILRRCAISTAKLRNNVTTYSDFVHHFRGDDIVEHHDNDAIRHLAAMAKRQAKTLREAWLRAEAGAAGV